LGDDHLAVMRRILVDFARSRGYQKRGGGAIHTPDGEQIEFNSNDFPTSFTFACDRRHGERSLAYRKITLSLFAGSCAAGVNA
jgi:hypothetical protein